MVTIGKENPECYLNCENETKEHEKVKLIKRININLFFLFEHGPSKAINERWTGNKKLGFFKKQLDSVKAGMDGLKCILLILLIIILHILKMASSLPVDLFWS